jgi:deoxycytidylate deaminase
LSRAIYSPLIGLPRTGGADDGAIVATGFVSKRRGKPTFADAGQPHDIVPKNIRSKLSSIIRIIHALENALLRSGELSMAVSFTL